MDSDRFSADGPPSSQGGSPPSERERRHLAVLFCDLMDSAALSEQLDVEDFRDLLASYHRVCSDAVRDHGGHVSQFLGDGVLCYFGYPTAREDDTVRAVNAALRLLDGVRLVNEGIGRRLGVVVRVRAGLHSGVAVLTRAGETVEELAVGETVNLAARLQSIAEPGTVVVSDTIARSVEGAFELRAVGDQVLKGFTKQVPAYCVVRAQTSRSTQ